MSVVKAAIALAPSERQKIVEAFFNAHPGVSGVPPGFGRAVLDFQAWEVTSGRIGEHSGSDWWRAVNGMMVLDIAAAAEGGSGASPAVDAWRAYASTGGGTQEALWEAHQKSLHRALRICTGHLGRERAAEQKFASIVIDVVDRTALAARPSDTSDLAHLTERFYPRCYPLDEVDLAPLERMRARTAEALRGPDGRVFLDVGMNSRRWG